MVGIAPDRFVAIIDNHDHDKNIRDSKALQASLADKTNALLPTGGVSEKEDKLNRIASMGELRVPPMVSLTPEMMRSPEIIRSAVQGLFTKCQEAGIWADKLIVRSSHPLE